MSNKAPKEGQDSLRPPVLEVETSKSGHLCREVTIEEPISLNRKMGAVVCR